MTLDGCWMESPVSGFMEILKCIHLKKKNNAISIQSSSFMSLAAKGGWQSGFFDQGSFMEIMGSWAQTVVVGRAR